jgi:hypothetical protein
MAKEGWDIDDEIPPGLSPEDIVKSIVEAPEVTAPRIVLTLPEFLATLTTLMLKEPGCLSLRLGLRAMTHGRADGHRATSVRAEKATHRARRG